MKKLLLMICFSIIGTASFAQSRTLIGSCTFNKDSNNKAPTNITSIGGDIQLHHNGSFKQTGSEGSVNVWKGTGDIWVIYNNSNARNKYRFVTTGQIQTCQK